MALILKKLVNKNSRRYQDDDFNLDLTYICPNLIAMAFPAGKGLESIYQNNIDDVADFLMNKHGNHFKVYNLCSEGTYDPSKFFDRVATYPFDKSKPPPFEVITSFCEDVDRWLTANKHNVAAIHCKDGKSRTGVMVCCYLLHRGRFERAEEVMKFFSLVRTNNMTSITIPSQIRYVNYKDDLNHSKLFYEQSNLTPDSIRFENLPLMLHENLSFSIYQAEDKLMSSFPYMFREKNISIYPLFNVVPLQGDVEIKVYQKQLLGKKEVFSVWFNAFFVKHQKELPSFDAERFVTLRSNAALHPSKRQGPIWEEHKTLEVAFEKTELDGVNKTDVGRSLPFTFRVAVCFNKDIDQVLSTSVKNKALRRK